MNGFYENFSRRQELCHTLLIELLAYLCLDLAS
jgi:hypothetical protein